MKPTQVLSNGSVECTRTTAFLVTDERTGFFVFDAAAIIQCHIEDDLFTAYIDQRERTSAERRRERLNNDPKKRAVIVRARQRIAGALPPASEHALAKLRLRAGLSQTDLARMLETQQPAIARLESGKADPLFSTIIKLATALGVSQAEVVSALENDKKSRTA